MSRGTNNDDANDFIKRLKLSLILLLFTLIIGTLGFKIAAGESFKDSFVLTLQALAFMFTSTSPAVKALEIFLALFGVFAVWWILWGLFDMLLEGNLSEYLKISHFLSKLKKMRNHYIVAGGGRVGENIAEHLAEEKKDYIILEKDESVINKLKRKNLFVMHGDATDESILKEAGIKDAKTIIITMPETEKNLLVTIMAKELNPEIEIFARADKPSLASKLKKAGAKAVIVPEQVAAEKFLDSIKDKLS